MSTDQNDRDIDCLIHAASIRQCLRVAQGCLCRIEATLDPVVDAGTDIPTHQFGHQVFSDARVTAKAQAKVNAAILADKLKEPYREHKRLMKAYRSMLDVIPPENNVAKWVTYAAVKRIIDEYHTGKIPLLSDARLSDVTKELEKVPVAVIKQYTLKRRPIYLDRELEEAIARHELSVWMSDADRKVLEQAFTKKFGHKP